MVLQTFYPANKKIVTLNSYSDDFTIALNYADLHFDEIQATWVHRNLGMADISSKEKHGNNFSEFGSRNLSSISVEGVKVKMEEAMSGEGSVFKGFKVIFVTNITSLSSLYCFSPYVSYLIFTHIYIFTWLIEYFRCMFALTTQELLVWTRWNWMWSNLHLPKLLRVS